MPSQVNNHEYKISICRKCLNPFNTEVSLNNHKEYCSSNEAVKVVMPGEGSILKFENIFKQMRVPFVVEADFESLIKNLDTSQSNPEQSYTKKYQKHTPSGFCYYIKSLNDKVYFQDPVIYTKQTEDKDIAQTFVNKLEQNIKEIYKIRGKIPMKITDEQWAAFKNATVCWI